MGTEPAQDWKSVQGISREEYAAKAKAGDFNKYLKDKDFQAALYSGKLFEKPVEAPKPETPAEVKPAPAPEIKPEVKPEVPAPKPQEPPKPESITKEPIWKKKGFATEEDFEQSVRDLEQTLLDSKKDLDRLNADRGREGLQLKKKLDSIEKEKEKLAQEVAKYKDLAQKTSVAVDLPKIPEIPIKEEDIASDENYAKQTKAYNEALKAYEVKLNSLITDVHTKNIQMADELRATKQQIADLTSQTQFVVEKTVNDTTNKELDDLFSEANALQSKHPELKTSSAFTVMNADVVKVHKGDMKPEEFQKKYNADDMNRYETISNYIKNYRTFDDKGDLVAAIPRKFKSLETLYIADMYESGKLQDMIAQTALEADRKAKKEVLDKMDQLANNVNLPAGEKVDVVRQPVEEDERNELRDLINFTTTKMGLSQMESKPAMIKRYIELADKFNAHGSKISIPPSWRDKFKT